MMLKNNKFLKPIIQLTTGSIIAQLITMLVSPVTTRLFTQEELGLYTLVLTVVSIFGPVLCLRYDMSIVTAKSKKSEYSLIIGSLIIGISISIIISIIYRIFFSSKLLPENINQNFIFLFLLLLLILTAIINTLTAFNNKRKEYGLISKVYVKRNLIQNVLMVITGFFKIGYTGLLLSQLGSMLSGIKNQSVVLLSEKEEIKKIKKNEVIRELITEKKQPLFSVPASILNSSSYSILNFFITGLFGLKVFGLYSMSYRILGLPLTLISGNISKVFFENASESYRKTGTYREILLKYTALLLVLAIPMSTGLFLFSEYIFEFVFGTGWGVAGIYVKILAPMYGIRLVVSTVSVSLIVSGKQQLELVLQFLFILFSVFGYIVCTVFSLNEYSFFIIISVTYSIVYIIFYFAIFKISKKDDV